MKRFSPPFCLLVLILIVIFSLPNPAKALSVKVNKSNLGSFKELQPKRGYYCYLDPSAHRHTGFIDGPKLVPGRMWQEQKSSSVATKIFVLKREIDRLSKNGKAFVSRLRIKKKELSASIPLLSLLLRYEKTCSDQAVSPTPVPTPSPTQTPVGPQFLGNPNSLSPYREQLTEDEVRHILRKVAYGGSEELIKIGKTKGLTALVDALVDGIGLAEPVNESELENAAEFWASQNFYFDPPNVPNARWTTDALRAGQIYRALYSKTPLREWMLMFLSAHFATNLGRINFSGSDYAHLGLPAHWQLLKVNALGNLNSLAKAMIEDSAMNAWLNNEDNHADAPNQNFAREFLELFTLGAIDPITSVPNYSQESILAATGYMSGYYEDSVLDSSTKDGFSRQIEYDAALHDQSIRTVFSGIAGAETTKTFEAKDFADYVMFHHPGSARFLVERLFAQMTYPDVPDTIVSELASDLKNANFELKPVVRKILKSEAMFSEAAIQPCIVSPTEFAFNLVRKLSPTPVSKDQIDKGNYLLYTVANLTQAAGQTIFEPPSVFAWKGSCGLNRGGAKSYGGGWLTAQNLLNRERGCVDSLNILSDIGFDLASVFPSKSISVDQSIDFLATNIFGFHINSEELPILRRFLTTDKQGDGSYATVDFNLSNPDYVARKIPASICLLSDTVYANSR